MLCEGYSWSTTTNADKCQVKNNRCGPGFFVKKNTTYSKTGGNVGPYSCEKCPDGTFSTLVNAKTCQKWRNCKEEDMVKTVAGTRTTDNKCVNCGPGQCPNELLHCPPGTYIKQISNNVTVDFKCQPCPTGFFQDQGNATLCLRWKVCGMEEYISNPGTATSDQECSFCEKLKDGFVQHATDAKICELFKPLSVGPAFPTDFVAIVLLTFACCIVVVKLTNAHILLKLLQCWNWKKRRKNKNERKRS
jgi:hypothetical protein